MESTNPGKMLEIENVSKSFVTGVLSRKVRALQALSLRVTRGEVYAFIGANGAGKTTTIKLILGLIFADSGRIFVNGIDCRDKRVRRHVGYLPDQPYFYDDLTACEYLQFAGKLFRLSGREIRDRVGELLCLVGLQGREKMRLRHYSRGMLQRLGLAQALIHDPEFLILDEPLTGLDPIGRKEFRDIILRLKQQGKTIFFSSHILADAEMVSDRVGILSHGRLAKEMALHDIQSAESAGTEIVFRKPAAEDWQSPEHPWQIEIFDHNGLIHLPDSNAVFQAIHWIEENGGTIISVTPKRKTLEDIFIEEVQQ